MMSRPAVAFFDLASCEGCQLQVANLGEELLPILELINLVEFRELMSETHKGRLDIAFVEGSVTNKEAQERLYAIRQRSELLVAYGSCATIGGVNGMANRRPLSDVQTAIDCDTADRSQGAGTRALHQLVKVDYFLHGCPIYPDEFLKVLKSALARSPYRVPDYAVCVECLINENICMYDKGVTCLGPVTRAGCNAWCINNGNVCYGCRGLVSNPNSAGAEAVLSRYNLDSNLIANKMLMYSAALEPSDG
jgi:coenzyme F420-reducing hydrogenase gamma subunit